MNNTGAQAKRPPRAFVVVGSVFFVIAVVLLAVAFWKLQHQLLPSTPLMIALAFGWAFFAMVVSMMLALPGSRPRGGGTRVRTGKVTLADPSPLPGQPRNTLSGPGVEMAGSATLTVGSPVPALWLGFASIVLAAVSVMLYLHGRTTGIGLLIGLIMAFFIMSWATKAWPRNKTPEPEPK